MSVKRYIDTSFWSDPFIQDLNPSEKYFYLYLITNPKSTIAGVFEISLRQMAFDTGYNQDTVKGLVQRFEDAGKLKYVDNYIILRNFIKNQLTNDSVLKGIRRELAQLPEKIRQTVDTLSTEWGESATYLNLNLNLNLNSNLNLNLNPNRDRDINLNSNSNLNRDRDLNLNSSAPSISEIKEYMKLKCITSFTAEEFFSYYESNGWKVGNNPMNNWQASLEVWDTRNRARPPHRQKATSEAEALPDVSEEAYD